MVLQLNSSTIGAGGLSHAGEAAPVSGGALRSGVARGSSGGNDSISVSGASSALNGLASDRAARVRELTATVQAGQYRVSSAALSSAIVGHAAAGG